MHPQGLPPNPVVDNLTKKLFAEIAEKVVSDTIEETMRGIIRDGGVARPMTTIVSTPSGGLTLEKLKEAMKELEALPPRLSTPMDYVLAGRWMATDRMCNQMVPAKPLAWKSWHERAGKYAFRTRKKWLKRFGLKPAMDKTQVLVDDYN